MLPGSVKIVGFQSSLKTFLHLFSLIGSGCMWIQLFMSKVNGENLLSCHSCCLLPNLHPVILKGAPKQFYVSSFSDILSISPNEQWKTPFCWVIKRVMLHLFIGIIISQYGNPVIKQPGFNGKQRLWIVFLAEKNSLPSTMEITYRFKTFP